MTLVSFLRNSGLAVMALSSVTGFSATLICQDEYVLQDSVRRGNHVTRTITFQETDLEGQVCASIDYDGVFEKGSVFCSNNSVLGEVLEVNWTTAIRKTEKGYFWAKIDEKGCAQVSNEQLICRLLP